MKDLVVHKIEALGTKFFSDEEYRNYIVKLAKEYYIKGNTKGIEKLDKNVQSFVKDLLFLSDSEVN